MTGSMNFEWLQAFVRISETGTFTGAAEQLYLSQSGLSRRIEALERALGEPLFIRGRRGVRLTQAGRRLLEDARPLVEGFEQVRRRARNSAYRDNRYAIGTTVSIGSVLLPRMMDRLQAAHPDVRIDVRSGFGQEVARWVRDGEVDLGIARLTPERQRLTPVPLYEEVLVPVAHPGHTLAGRTAVAAAELAAHAIVHYVAPSNFVDLLDRFWEARGLRPAVCARADRVEAVRQLLIEGRGIGFLPSGYVQRDRDVGLLSVLALGRDELPRYPIGVVMRQGARATPFIDELIETLRASVPVGADPGGRHGSPLPARAAERPV